MMTEDQKRALSNWLPGRISHLNDKESTQEGGLTAGQFFQRASYQIALSALTQPASPALKLPDEDYFSRLVDAARQRAEKAMRKFPQPNYVLNKVAEESGEVIKAVIHYTEGREDWLSVEGELIDNLAMLIRLVKEGDQVIGFNPPDEVKRLNAPHTAPIEPICATGGAEWVKCSVCLPEVNEEVIAFIAQSHEYKGKAFPGVRYEEYWWLDGETYSYDEVSHWQPMPAPPRD